MPETFVEKLKPETLDRMVELLNDNLASTIDLTLAVKQAHWNLKGRGFIGVHELLDDVAGRLRDSSDLIAERAVILGGHARGTVQVAEKGTKLDPYPTEIERVQDHVAALKERFMTLGGSLREAIDEADEAGDQDTADLFTEVSRTVDKDAWFIGANAEGN